MGEINDTTTYPNTAPALSDHVIGTDVSNTVNDPTGETVTFTWQAVMDLFEANMAAPTSAISSGTFADARIAESNVTQHQAALSITESQISDLGTYFEAADSPTWTGTHSFNSATVTLPQSATPTPTTEGQITWDTDNDVLRIGDGAATLTFTDDANLSITKSQISDADYAVVSGTPADNRIAVWTGATGIEGDANLTWDGTLFSFTGGLVFNERADHASTPAAGKAEIWVSNAATQVPMWTDDAGTDANILTGTPGTANKLSKWDANGRLVEADETSLADPNADRGIGWDDSAGQTAFWTAGTGLSFDASFNLNAEVSLAGSETLTNKTLTQPALTLTQSATPTPTAEGVIEWDTDNNQIKVGDGAGTKTFSDDAGLSITVSQISDYESSSPTWTGAHDFGGATSLEIPNSATPTVNADGEVAVDTTVTDFSHGVMKYYGGEELGVVAMPIAQFTTPTNGNVVAYNATNNEFELVAAGSGDLLSTNNLSDVANAGTARTNLGLAIGTNVQAYDAGLNDIAGLAVTDGNFIVGNGTNWVAESAATARASMGAGSLDNVVEDPTPQLGGALDGQGNDLNNMGVLFLTEQAAAEVDVAGKGQFWVQTATPNVPMFTDDAGTDGQIVVQGGALGTPASGNLGSCTAYPGDSSLTTVGTVTTGNVDAVVSASSTTTAGKIEIATVAEIDTGTDNTRAVSPDGLAGSDFGKEVVTICVFDDSEDVATGDGAGDQLFRVPSKISGWNLVEVAAYVQTAGTTGTTDIQLHNVTSAADILSTKMTIDSAETDTNTAATAAVINTAEDDVATADKIRVDVDAVSTTAPKGLWVELTFQAP